MLQVSFAQIAALLAITPNLIAAVPVTSVVTSTTTTTTSTATPTPSALSCPASDGQIITVGTDSFNIQCGVDYYGGDLTMSWETSLESCIATCESTAGCIIVSYNGAACYMKDTDNSPQTNANVWAAKKVIAGSSSTSSSTTFTSTATTTPTSAAVACPASDGATYTAKEGAIFKIECSTDRYGSDLDMAWVSDLQSCIETCEATTGCVDVSYRPGTPGPCYMKNSYEQEARTDSGVWGAIRVGTASSSATTSSATSTSTDASSTSSTSSSSSTSAATSSTTTSSATSSSTSSSTPLATPTPAVGTCGYINNPSFESLPATSLDWAVTSKTSAVNAPYADFHYRYGGPKAGLYNAYFATYATDNSLTFGTTIQQVTAGFRYTVSFWYRMNPQAIITGSVDDIILLNVPRAPNTIWYQTSLTFTATSTTAKLAFKISSVIGANGYMFDDFTITPVTPGCIAAGTVPT